MTATTKSVICDGSLVAKIRETPGIMSLWSSKVFACVSRTLLRDIPTCLTIGLANVLQKALHWKISLERRPGKKVHTTKVFDLVNCGPNHRFHTLTGYVAHNCLGLSYGMGPAKMVTSAYDKGYVLSLDDAKRFHRVYWELFSDVRRFSNMLGRRVEETGCIVNPFGYRLTPEPHKAFNAFIQSSVSGIIHVLRAKIATAAPYALMNTIIHDELLYDVPTDKLDQFRLDKERATESLNADLGWTIKIRSGFAPGSDWYTAK